VEGFEMVLAGVEAIDEDDPRRPAARTRRAAVDLAFRAPGHMAVMFRHGLANLCSGTDRSIEDDPAIDHLVRHAASIVTLCIRAVSDAHRTTKTARTSL
jgi:hypothetical protein